MTLPIDLFASQLTPGDRVAVTGASGWFGRTALTSLSRLWGTEAADRVLAYASTAKQITLADGTRWQARELSRIVSDPAPTVVMHFAYLTRDRAVDLGNAQYLQRNVGVSALVLEAIRRHRPRVVLAVSSGAVYAPDRSLVHDVDADPYGALKVVDELAFAGAAEAVGASWSIPRVFSVAGPGITKPEKYALGSMIAMALAGGPIEISAPGPVLRSYCGVDEVLALALWAARNKPSGVFDTAGHVVEMADLAAAVSSGVGRGCAIVRPSYDPRARPDRYVGDPTGFAELVAQSGLRIASLDTLVRATANDLESGR